MARIPSSPAALALALVALSGLAAAQGLEPPKSLPAPSIAATALPGTATVPGPAVSADISTDTGGTNLSASLKLAGSGPVQWWNSELAVQSAQQGGGTGAVFDTGDTIANGAQLSLAISYANIDVLPASDPKVKAFLDALHKCRAFSSTKLREQVAAIQQARKAGQALEEKEQKLVDAGCTYSEGEAAALAEDARNKPFLFAVKATVGRSDTTFLVPGTLQQKPDLVKFGASLALGKYLLSNLVLAGSFKWSNGNVVAPAPVNVCHQIDVDPAGNPVTECLTGTLGDPVRGNQYRASLELRHLIGAGLAWNPSVTLTFSERSAPRVRAQVPILFQLVPGSDQEQRPLTVGVTVGYTTLAATPLAGTFLVAGTLQTQFGIGKL